MPRVTVNDINMHYEVHGTGDPVVLIQGLGGNHTFWYPNLPELKKHFRIVLLDYRGSGDTDKPDMPYTIRMFADDIAALMGTIGLSRAHVVGRSMGGCIAQELAINHPDRVRSLILAATWAKADGYLARLFEARIRLVEKVGLKGMFETGVFMSYTREFFDPTRAQDREDLERLVFANDQPPRFFALQALAGRDHDARDRLARITAPTLVVVGTQDLMCPPPFSREITDRIPGATLKVLDGLGHAFYEQAPEVFNTLAMEFWRAH